MRVRLLKKSTIEKYARNNARSKTPLTQWHKNLRQADWEEPNGILNTYPSADLLGNGSDRVVFNIAGNNYRMICKYWFTDTSVHLYIKWLGTHAEYDELCRKNRQYTVQDY